MAKLACFKWLKIIAFLLVLYVSMAFITQIVVLKVDDETVVKVEPRYNYADVGETFTVNVTVANVQNLYGVEIVLQWNASILQVTHVDLRLGVNESRPDGVLYSPVFIAKNETSQAEGRYYLAATSYNPAPPYSGTGNIVKITFIALAAGNCTLELTSKLIDWPPPDREPRIPWLIQHTTVDGYFIIIPEFPGNLASLMFVIIFLAFVVIFNRFAGSCG